MSWDWKQMDLTTSYSIAILISIITDNQFYDCIILFHKFYLRNVRVWAFLWAEKLLELIQIQQGINYV